MIWNCSPSSFGRPRPCIWSLFLGTCILLAQIPTSSLCTFSPTCPWLPLVSLPSQSQRWLRTSQLTAESSHAGCLMQISFKILFGCLDNVLLTVMAYPQFVVLCHLLNYLVIINSHFVVCWVLVSFFNQRFGNPAAQFDDIRTYILQKCRNSSFLLWPFSLSQPWLF